MKLYETAKKMVEREEVVLHEIKCDLCGKIAKHPEHHIGPSWMESGYEFEVVQVSKVSGCHYPEGGSETRAIVDVCNTCFDAVLIPFLQSKGAQPREEKVLY